MKNSPLADDDFLLSWVETLTGQQKERVREAAHHVASWAIPHVTSELLERPSIDNAIAALNLSSSVQALAQAGVPENKLLSKLRNDRDVWPTWTEFRAAALLMRTTQAKFGLEVNRSTGKHPDYQVSVRGSAPASIEFKAIGLSDQEADFCRRVSPAVGYVPSALWFCYFSGSDRHAPSKCEPGSHSTNSFFR